MKEKIKFFLIGFIVCLSLGGMVYGVSQVMDVYYSEFPITIDSYEYTPTMPVLNYQGRTYLALREFGNATGTNIDFQNNTILIDNYKRDGLYCMALNKFVLMDNLSKIDNINDNISNFVATYSSVTKDGSEKMGDYIKITDMYIKEVNDNMDLLIENGKYANKSVNVSDIKKLENLKNEINDYIEKTESYQQKAYTYVLNKYWDKSIADTSFDLAIQFSEIKNELYSLIDEESMKYFSK